MEENMKFNSQVCTTKEQSERLLKLGLNPETADMYYHEGSEDGAGNIEFHRNIRTECNNILFPDYIPAWSLHRLLEMLPYTMTFRLKKHKITLYDICRTIPSSTSPGNTYYDALINAIEGLIDLGKFNKQYLKE